MIHEHQLEQFKVFGFLVLKGILTPLDMKKAYDEFEIGLSKSRKSAEGLSISHHLNWSNLGPDTPLLASLLEDERFFSTAQQILGKDAVGLASNGNSFDSDRTEWHPDVGNPDWNGIKFAFYLQPVGRNSGALRLVPGSHREPFLSDFNKIRLKGSEKGTIDGIGLSVEEVPCFAAESETGDVVLFDNNIWHASYGGGIDRRMCSLGYFANPKNAREEKVMASQVERTHRLHGMLPHLDRHPLWLENADCNQTRAKWISDLKKWGFVK